MVFDEKNLEDRDTPEAKASEELLKLGLADIPENRWAVLGLQETPQHPKGYEDIVESDSLEDIGAAMKKHSPEVKQVIHAEGPDLWTHCKLAIKLVELLDIPEEKKEELKLIMLYHDVGKAMPGLSDRPEVKAIQEKEKSKGKLYKVAKGHAGERLWLSEAGFKANGITDRRLDIFMNVVQNHMETSLSRMTGPQLVKLFKGFGKNDQERKEVAELLAYAIQVDGNACMQLGFDENGELQNPKEENKTGVNFNEIWQRYLEAEGK